MNATTPIEPDEKEKLSAKKRFERMFAEQCAQYRLPPPITQHMFAKEAMGRRWAFDFCWPEYKVAAEIEGLVVRKVYVLSTTIGAPIVKGNVVANLKEVKPMTVTMGRHATITGMREDAEKYNSAALLGWTVLRFEQNSVKPGTALEVTMKMLAAKGWRAGL